MLAAQQLPAQSFQNTIESPSIDSVEPQLHQHNHKTEIKSSRFSLYKIVLGIAILFIAALVGYKLYTLAFAGSAASKINGSHSKFIQTPDSSSGKDSGSTSGNSQSSTKSQDSSKPMSTSQTTGKQIIAPQSSPTGSDGNGDDPQDDDDAEGSKRNKFMNKNKASDTTSTQQDSDGSAQEEQSEQNEQIDELGMSYNGRNNIQSIGMTKP